jgi:hypothetical protein
VAVVSGGAVAMGMAHYLDAEDGQASVSHSLSLSSFSALTAGFPGFVLPTPWHFLKRLKKIDKFALIKRPEDFGFTGTNEGPAIRDKAIHRVCDAFMFVPAGIDAIILSKTSHVCNAGHGRRG